MKYLAAHTIRETAKAFEVSPATLQNWRKLKLETDDHQDREQHPRPKKIPPEELEAQIAAHPGWYQREFAELFNCSAAAIGKAMRKAGYSRKKTPPMPSSRRRRWLNTKRR